MSVHLPVTLEGENLGKRHKQFNCMVNNAYKTEEFSSIINIPEKSPLDRLFKIELAVKHRDVDYIINTLKDEDMLYVSRALKGSWLLESEYHHVFNPSYLEDVLYPQMRTTAATKTKHWIYLNLKHPHRLQEFYNYYKEKNFDTAFKFLWKCSKDFKVTEMPKILVKMTPRRFKLLIEGCPEMAKIYFENFQNIESVLSDYIAHQTQYYNQLKCLLKLDIDLFLDITEKHFCRYNFKRFSADATKYIMKHRKDRFNRKAELYTAWLLDIKTLAKCLNEEEIKELVLKLSRAKYLEDWFSYKEVAPLIKAINFKERASFKSKVFVEKAVGDIVEDWPYAKPEAPEVKYRGGNIFEDEEHNPREYEHLDLSTRALCGRAMLKKKSCRRAYEITCVRKTSLDQLFDRVRFMNFDKVLFELRKQLKVETMQHRQNIMLVLVSKSGGRPESIEQLLKLLATQHENEAENLRATIIRSLVRRCSIWRLPENIWELLLKFGRGLGLDGKPTTVACNEGLHAVIIRHILLDTEIDENIWQAFLQNFSTLTEYTMTADEKQKILLKLPSLLINTDKSNSEKTVERLEQTFNVLNAYKIRADKYPEFIATVAATARRNPTANSLLSRLFNAKVARKDLFKENFAIIQTEASYLNALKHDPSILSSGEYYEVFIKSTTLAHNRFLKRLSLFFNEKDGLAQKYLSLLKIEIEASPKAKLARSIAILSSAEFLEIMKRFDDASQTNEAKRFGVALRANAHLVRPLIDIHKIGWEFMGAKAVANRVLTCDTNSVDKTVESLLMWRKTQRLAFVLSLRTGKQVKVLEATSKKRPIFTLKTALWHLRKGKLSDDVWQVIIPLISKVDSAGKVNKQLRKLMSNVKIVPNDKKPHYCVAVYKVFSKISKYEAMPMLCNIEHILPDIEEGFLEGVVQDFLDKKFIFNEVKSKNWSHDVCVLLYVRIIAKSLISCKSEDDQEKRWKSLGEPFLDRFEELWINIEDKSNVVLYLEDFLRNLKYTKVFLDTKHTSCLPMFEKIANRLQKFIFLHEHYSKYIHLHLTMLYFKTVRQAVNNNPTVFEDLPNNWNKATEAVGQIFGKYIAREVIELREKYFDSIRDIYKDEFLEYLMKYFEQGEMKKILITNIMRGIIEYKAVTVFILVANFYQQHRNLLLEDAQDEILQVLKRSEDMEVVFFVETYL